MSSYLTPLSRILVLTNDSLGSTYFQRVLSLYLNIYFSPTINLHDIVNHYNGNFKNLLVSLLSYQDSLVCRASQYRLSEIRENPKNIYKILNLFFNRIFCIKRNSFETALSLSIVEHFNHPLNVYESDQFEEVFSSPASSIPLSIFKNKLGHIKLHMMWVDNNFKNVEWLSHEDIVFDIDNLLNTLFPVQKLSFSFQSLNNNLIRYDRGLEELTDETCTLLTLIKDIHEQNPAHSLTLSRKKFTLAEKINIVSNFDELFEYYQTLDTNFFEKVTSTDLTNLVEKERTSFGLS